MIYIRREISLDRDLKDPATGQMQTLADRLSLTEEEVENFQLIASQKSKGSDHFFVWKTPAPPVLLASGFDKFGSLEDHTSYLVNSDEMSQMADCVIDLSNGITKEYSLFIRDGVTSGPTYTKDVLDTEIVVDDNHPVRYAPTTSLIASIVHARGMPSRVIMRCHNIARVQGIISAVRYQVESSRDLPDGFYVENISGTLMHKIDELNEMNWIST